MRGTYGFAKASFVFIVVTVLCPYSILAVAACVFSAGVESAIGADKFTAPFAGCTRYFEKVCVSVAFTWGGGVFLCAHIVVVVVAVRGRVVVVSIFEAHGIPFTTFTKTFVSVDVC